MYCSQRSLAKHMTYNLFIIFNILILNKLLSFIVQQKIIPSPPFTPFTQIICLASDSLICINRYSFLGVQIKSLVFILRFFHVYIECFLIFFCETIFIYIILNYDFSYLFSQLYHFCIFYMIFESLYFLLNFFKKRSKALHLIFLENIQQGTNKSVKQMTTD